MISSIKYIIIISFLYGWFSGAVHCAAENRNFNIYERLGVDNCQELFELSDDKIVYRSMKAIYSPVSSLNGDEQKVEYIHSIYLLKRYPKTPFKLTDFTAIASDSYKNCEFWNRINGKSPQGIILIGKSIHEEILRIEVGHLAKTKAIIQKITPPDDTEEDVRRKVAKLDKMIDEIESTPFITDSNRSSYLELLDDLRY